MKKIISFTCAVILAAVSYSFADEAANKAEVSSNEITAAVESKASVVELTQPVETPKAEEVKTNKAVASNVAPSSQPARRSYTRQEIRSMNILDRPNRPGHFYGNTVRRRHGR